MVSTKTLTAILISVAFASGSRLLADENGNPTTTTLIVSSSSLTAGMAVTLTATVTGKFAPVTKGQVAFCDARAARCDGAAVFGIAQVTGGSTAAITRTLGVGSYTIQAVFAGFAGVGGSTSSPQAITVTGAANYGSSTAIAASGGVGNYTLTATLTAFGSPTATGSISYLDTSYGDNEVASVALDPGTFATVFNPASQSPLADKFAQFVVSADFNQDGIPDLAIVNLAVSGTVSVFIGNGDGTFQSPVNYRVGLNPQMLAVADVNGDGALDLIVANKCATKDCSLSSVSILLGAGDGTFQPQVSFSTGCFTTFVAVADFNNDGWPDLAAVNYESGTVSILLGSGDASLFGVATTYGVGSHPEGIAVGDLNQDGIPDLAVSNLSDGTISILLGNGDGTFKPRQPVVLPDSVRPYWLVAADLRNIGTIDLVVPDSGASNNIYVLLGNGDGSFRPPVGYTVDAGPYGVSVGDMNGDGVLDLVVPNTAENEDAQVSVLLGDGNGTFGAKTDYAVGSNPTFVALADFNSDGLLDVATSNSGSSDATILLQAHTETATATNVAVYPSGPHNVLASYPGDNDRAPSRSTTVDLMGSSPTSTTTALAASPNPATVLQPVSLSAAVTPAPTGSALGTVSFYNSATLLGSVNLNSSGVATFSTANLPAGVDSLIAVYSGNSAFATSTSIPVLETITSASALEPTFMVTTQQTSVTAPPSGSVTIDASILPSGGAFNNVVTMSVTGLPPGALASFNPLAVIPGVAGAQTVLTGQVAVPAARVDPLRKIPLGSFAFSICLCGIGFTRKHLSRRVKRALALISFASLALTLIGCGGGGFLRTSNPQPNSYVVTITGTSGSLQSSATVTLVVP